ncbi:hypothetical protein Abol_015_241 [Acetobacter orleanensis JCM 7639]|nr:hypothetical protein Abol_015_241 [Acetobacter orleanensis JCM 7639]
MLVGETHTTLNVGNDTLRPEVWTIKYRRGFPTCLPRLSEEIALLPTIRAWQAPRLCAREKPTDP